MRPVNLVLMIVMVIGLIGFVFTNQSARVSVTLLNTQYAGVRLALVVVLAFAAGAGFCGLVAMIEGAADRLANRRLRKRVDALETELEVLRSQTVEPRGPEPDEPKSEPETPSGAGEPPRRDPPSAPVWSQGPTDALPRSD